MRVHTNTHKIFDLIDVRSSRKDVENFCTALEEKAVCVYNVIPQCLTVYVHV